MKHYETNATIAAEPSTVWSVLTDGPGYTSWDNGVEKVEGRIELGEKITVHAEISSGRAFPVKVTQFDPAEAMTWTGGMPLGLFKGIRTFHLSAASGGGTEFNMREEFSGPMLPLIWRSMPDLAPAFEQFAQGLKAEAESRR